MNRLYWYLILSTIWMLLRSDFTLSGLLIGFALSVMVLWLSEKMNPRPTSPFILKEIIKLSGLFLLAILRANITLARDIIWHRKIFRHAFLEVDCSELSPTQTVLLGNMISLTPGSLTVDADDSGKTLFIHTLYGDDIGTVKAQIATMLIHMSRMGAEQDNVQPEEILP